MSLWWLTNKTLENFLHSHKTVFDNYFNHHLLRTRKLMFSGKSQHKTKTNLNKNIRSSKERCDDVNIGNTNIININTIRLINKGRNKMKEKKTRHLKRKYSSPLVFIIPYQVVVTCFKALEKEPIMWYYVSKGLCYE